MTPDTLVQRSLGYYWRVNLVVVAGVGVAVAVLSGALLVGASVRGSLRDLALGRLGHVDTIVTAETFFGEALAARIEADPNVGEAFDAFAPIIALDGLVTNPGSGRRAFGVQVYGVDERFWSFHERTAADRALSPDGAFISEELARELGVAAGDAVLIRVERPTDAPLESLHGRREDVGRTIRLTAQAVLSRAELGEFSLRQRQGPARTVFVPVTRLQRDLNQPERANTILVRSAAQAPVDPAEGVARLERAIRDVATLGDLGVTVRTLPDHDALVVETDAGMLSDAIADASRAAALVQQLRVQPILTYVVNTLRLDGREVPYSLLTAVDFPSFSALSVSARRSSGLWPEALEYPPILLNEWAVADLGAHRGDIIEAEYYVWEADGRLLTETADFQLFGVLPIAGAAADRDLAPEYEGITTSDSLADWDPPFPIDLSLIGPRDEEYWDRYRTTPKGFIEIGAGQSLWQSRYGQLTSIRVLPPEGTALEDAVEPYRRALAAELDPVASGIGVTPVRALALEASVGATDFGEYFTYFSFFLVVSALLLTSLFFRLGVEQRLTEIGALQAFGFSPARVRTLFWQEAVVLSLAGSIVGIAGAIGYAELIMFGLRTWWVDAVGTTLLTLHVTPATLLGGAAGGVIAALGSIGLAFRSLARVSPRGLLTGSLSDLSDTSEPLPAGASSVTFHPSMLTLSVLLTLVGVGLLGAAMQQMMNATAGFFGAGTVLLCALLGFAWTGLRRRASSNLVSPGMWPAFRLGFRNTTYRPGRSVLCIALIAFAAFIIVAVDAFRREGADVSRDRTSGTGGFTLLADSLLPVAHDLEATAGRDALGLIGPEDDLRDVGFAQFRVRSGDDASCLNLYQAKDPRVLAPTDAFLEEGRFAFGRTLAEGADTLANPWLLLDQDLPDDLIPAIADANSLTYALHLSVGDELTLNADTDRPVRLRIVAALTDSIFQRELIIAERHFRHVFPAEEGFRFFLLDVEPARAAAVSAALESRLSDFGFDVTSSADRLAAFHRVENTYLATFQTLGGLGLLLGTFGLAAVLLRNVLERRREIALLRAVGYDSRHLSMMIVAENTFLLAVGLATGTICALLAIAPAWLERGQRLPLTSVGWLLLAVAVAGMGASLLATWTALRAPLLEALRTE